MIIKSVVRDQSLNSKSPSLPPTDNTQAIHFMECCVSQMLMMVNLLRVGMKMIPSGKAD